MAQTLIYGVVTGVAAIDNSDRMYLMVADPAIDGTHVGIEYERHHAQRLLQLYGGRKVAVMEHAGARWLRIIDEAAIAAAQELQSDAEAIVADYYRMPNHSGDAGLKEMVLDGVGPSGLKLYNTLSKELKEDAEGLVQWPGP